MNSPLLRRRKQPVDSSEEELIGEDIAPNAGYDGVENFHKKRLKEKVKSPDSGLR